MNNIIGNNVRKFRNIKGWTQTDLSYRIGTSSAHVCMIESGKRNPSIKTLRKIARAFRVPMSHLTDRVKVKVKVVAA